MSLDVGLCGVDAANVQRLRELNVQLFPVRYNAAFYQDVVQTSAKYAKLAYVEGDVVVGAICCRLEDVKSAGDAQDRRQCVYIMTLGVLEDYRRARIGSLLLESVVAHAIDDGLSHVYLHVQTSNTPALKFYRQHGFEVTQLVRNYYKRLEPPDCYVLRRQLAS